MPSRKSGWAYSQTRSKPDPRVHWPGDPPVREPGKLREMTVDSERERERERERADVWSRKKGQWC